MLHILLLHLVLLLLGDCGVLDGLGQRPPSVPPYLPVHYRLLDADSAFFLTEADQDFMRNSSSLSRTESFFVHRARTSPLINASYGPVSVERPVPLELLQSPGTTFPASPVAFAFNWKMQTFVLNPRVHLARPTVQVLFYVTGRDWDDHGAVHRLPCVHVFAFHETQQVHGTCRLRGQLGLCVAQLEPHPGWFGPPGVVPGRQRVPGTSEGTPVELYYQLRSTEAGECRSEEAGSREEPSGSFASSPLNRIGSVRLYRDPAPAPLVEHRLDDNFMVTVPAVAVKQKETLSAVVSVSASSPVETFTLRVKLKEGVTFLGARPSSPTQWMVSQDVRSEGHRVVTLHCRRKESSYDQHEDDLGVLRVLQVDLKVEGSVEPLDARRTAWQVEYPGSRTLTREVETELRVAREDVVGLVPLAMNCEILNTALLTGKTVAVPLKAVTVGADASVTDVSDVVRCRSTDEEVAKVSDRCDYVFVTGKEMKGRVKMKVNFTYGHLSSQLELNVWIPRLPLKIEVSDLELSQIRGWRVPVPTPGQRSTRDSEGEDDEAERRGRGCTLQYQQTVVKVLTAFVADEDDPPGQTVFMLSSDWQVDVTAMVWDFLKVEDPRVARLLDAGTLVGLDPGRTSIQVLSPLSESILAERTVAVVEDKVSITDLSLQLVTDLSMSLQLSPGSNRAIVATTSTREVLQSPKQEAWVGAWLHFSDGSAAPLDLYGPDLFVLTATSLDETVVTVRHDPWWRLPVVVAEAEGQGVLVRVEMTVRESCQKSRRRSALASGSCDLRVRFDRGPAGDNVDDRGQDRTGLNTHSYGSPVPEVDEGVWTRTSAAPSRPGGDRPSGGSQGRQNFADFPDRPGGGGGADDELVRAAQGLTDLEIGMYALLGVFCLAVLVFLINCVSYTLKYRHKELPLEERENTNHAHDWVWTGNEAEPLESRIRAARTSALDSGGGLHLLNGGSAQKGKGRGTADGENKGDSPTTRRKRVQFTTFTTIPPEDDGRPTVNTLSGRRSRDIQWVCPDLELGGAKELRS